MSAAEAERPTYDPEDPDALLAALRMMLAYERGDMEAVVGVMGVVDAERRFTALAGFVKAAVVLGVPGADYEAELRRWIREEAARPL